MIEGGIYFLRSGARVKVGFTTNLSMRLKSFQTANAELSVLGLVKGTIRDERNIHKRLSKHRIKGEWFHLNEETKREIESIIAAGKPPTSIQGIPKAAKQRHAADRIVSANRRPMNVRVSWLVEAIVSMIMFAELASQGDALNRISKELGLARSLLRRLRYGERREVAAHEFDALVAMFRKCEGEALRRLSRLREFGEAMEAHGPGGKHQFTETELSLGPPEALCQYNERKFKDDTEKASAAGLARAIAEMADGGVK